MLPLKPQLNDLDLVNLAQVKQVGVLSTQFEDPELNGWGFQVRIDLNSWSYEEIIAIVPYLFINRNMGVLLQNSNKEVTISTGNSFFFYFRVYYNFYYLFGFTI